MSRKWLADGVSENFVYATNGLIAYTNRDSKVTYYGRDAAGRLTSLTNANTQVTQFAYNALDEITNLIDGRTNSTFWYYNQFGWVTNKVDASNHVAFVYAYDANGRLTNRWTPVSTNTSYSYDPVGNLTNITYSGSSPATNSYAYDALNRLTNMVDAIGATAFTYTQVGRLASESNPFTSLSGAISYSYTQGQRTGLTLTQLTGNWTQTYGYDSGWRMNSLTSPAGTFGYGYTAASASALVQSISLPNAAYIANAYDSLARMTNTALVNRWGHVLNGYSYGYDHLGLRTNIVRNLGLTANAVTVGYDGIGQLTSWNAEETNGTIRLNEQNGYGFDAAGNLSFRTNGALVQTFAVDALNQLSSITRSGTLTLSGATPAPATNVTVNTGAAQTYGDLTFARTNLALTNGTNTFAIVAHNSAGATVTNTLSVNLPSTNVFLYDGNGNLTNDGTRSFAYNAENQLTNAFVVGQWRTELLYDGLRRRRVTREYSWTGSSWLQTNETRFLYDGMLVIQERDTNNGPQVTYTRGLDFSGSIHRGGGMGGMLAKTDVNGSTYYHADGAGNVTALMDSGENIAARYEYDPFGNLINEWGPLANLNPVRFSSKSYIPGVDGYDFGLRIMCPKLQQFLTADPTGEAGGIPLHGFVGNSPINDIDPYGLCPSHAIWDDGPNYSHLPPMDPEFYGGGGLQMADVGVAVTAVAVAAPVQTATFVGFGALDEMGPKPPPGMKIGMVPFAPGGIPEGVGAAGEAESATGAAKSIGKCPEKPLRRPYVRKPTRAKVEAGAPRTADGRPIDPNTLKPIDGKPDLGHVPGSENWREIEKAESEGLNQSEFNDRMNDPSKYQLEDPPSNRSHRHEKP